MLHLFCWSESRVISASKNPIGLFGNNSGAATPQNALKIAAEVHKCLWLKALFITTHSSCFSHCIAVSRRLCRLPPGPYGVHDEIVAGPEADEQAQAAE